MQHPLDMVCKLCM